jgi:SAM-dependent methyltransferase
MIDKPFCLACGGRGIVVYADCSDFYCRSEGLYSYSRCPNCNFLWITSQPDGDALLDLYQKHYNDTLERMVLNGDTTTTGVSGDLKALIRRAVLERSLGYPVVARGTATARLLGQIADRVPFLARRARYGLGLTFPPYSSGRRLLDVGCGLGWYVKLMNSWGWNAVGVEANPISAKRGREIYGIDIREGTLEGQKFPDCSFDAICSRHVLEHVPDPEGTLREMRRILRPGGWLGLAMPNGFSLASRWFGKNWRGATPPWHIHLFSPKALRLLLHRTGFERIRVETSPQSAHWVYTASQQIRKGTYVNDAVPSNWGFQLLEVAGNLFFGDWGEEMEAVAETPSS